MKHAHLRHLRCTRPAYGTREHFDWSANGDSLRELEPAEHIQREERAATISIHFALCLALFGAGIIVHHVLWSAKL